MALEQKFTVEEMEASFRRAFVAGKSDFIRVDGHSMRSPFLRAALNHALDKKLIYQDDHKSPEENQWTEYHYRLTEEGKRYFKLK